MALSNGSKKVEGGSRIYHNTLQLQVAGTATYCHSPLATHHLPLTTRHTPHATCHSPLTTHHSPLTPHPSPLTTHSASCKQQHRKCFILHMMHSADIDSTFSVVKLHAQLHSMEIGLKTKLQPCTQLSIVATCCSLQLQHPSSLDCML